MNGLAIVGAPKAATAVADGIFGSRPKMTDAARRLKRKRNTEKRDRQVFVVKRKNLLASDSLRREPPNFL